MRTNWHQEKFPRSRPNFDKMLLNGKATGRKERSMHPDIDNGAPFQYSFYVPVQKQDFHLLPHL